MGSFAAENTDRGQMDLQARCATRGNWNANGGQFGVQDKDKTRTNKKIKAKKRQNQRKDKGKEKTKTKKLKTQRQLYATKGKTKTMICNKCVKGQRKLD